MRRPFEVLPAVHSISVGNQKPENTNLAALLTQTKFTSFIFSTDDVLHGDLKASPSNYEVQARLAAALPSPQPLNKVVIKPRKQEPRPKIDASTENFGLATTTSFSKKQLRTINF